MKVTLDPNWLNHVVKLAQQVYKMDGLMSEVLKSLCLLFIKVLHLVRSYDLIVIQIDNFEPVA